MKSNRDMNQMEFDYSHAVKRAIHQLNYVKMELESAKNVGMQGISDGALRQAEIAAADLKISLYNALKTVGK